MEPLLADIYMIWGVPVTFLFLLCTAPGLVSAVLGCTMNDLSKASSRLGANPVETALGCRETCLCETGSAQSPGNWHGKEERLGGEGSDARGAGGAGPGLGLCVGCEPGLLPSLLSLEHFGRGATELG